MIRKCTNPCFELKRSGKFKKRIFLPVIFILLKKLIAKYSACPATHQTSG